MVTVESSIFTARDRHELSMSSIAFQPRPGTMSGCERPSLGSVAERRGERGGREGAAEGEGSVETVVGG